LLPVLNIAKQQITVPFVNKTYTIRPYLVGEEKGLMMSLESRDDVQIAKAIKNLIVSCVEEKINIDDLSTFETEYIFLQLRIMSVSNISEVGFGHQHSTECQHIQKVTIDLNQIQIDGKIDNKVLLDEESGIGVMLTMPSNKTLAKKYNTETEKVFGLIQDSIQAIYDKQSVYYTKDVAPDELTSWINNLNNSQMRKIADFFSDLPTMNYDIKYKCEKCGEIEEFKVTGLSNFL
jgi:hypothetical protein